MKNVRNKKNHFLMLLEQTPSLRRQLTQSLGQPPFPFFLIIRVEALPILASREEDRLEPVLKLAK